MPHEQQIEELKKGVGLTGWLGGMRKSFHKLPSVLDAQEQLIGIAIAADSKYRPLGAAAVTDRRILIVRKRALGTVTHEVPWDTVRALTTFNGAAFGRLSLTTLTGVVNLTNLREKALADLAAYAQRRIQVKPLAAQAAPAKSSDADELVKLHGLLRAGAISQQEFTEMKARVVRR